MREHWLEHAHGRIVAGDDELEVLADYGWVQITAVEREAIERALEASIYYAGAGHRQAKESADTLRKLLERMK